jgi:TP901 family phage tail tape measure protein
MADNAIVGILRVLLTADTAEYEAGLKSAQRTAKQLSSDFKSIGQQATALGQSLTRTLTLPLAALGAGAAKVAVDFESSFAGVRKTVDATDAEFVQMAQAFRDLAKEIPINVNELNRLGEAAGALGIPKAEIVDFSKVMAQLGVTTNLTADQAAQSIAEIQNIFRSAGKDTDRFAATLVDLGNKGASTEQDILSLANRLASAGLAIGLSQAEVLGFASAIANVGIEAEAGGSAISRVFSDISIAVSKGGDAVQSFAAVAGQSADAFSKLFRDDAAQAVRLFIEGLGRMSEEGADLNLVLEQLGFTEIRQARALRDLALSGENVAKSLNTANTAWRENSALTEEARKRFETTEAQLTLLWNRIKDVGITLGNALLPVIKSAVDVLSALIPIIETLARAFAVLPQGMQLSIIATGALVAAAGPLLIVFGQLISAAGLIIGAFTKTGIATRALALLFPTLTTATVATTTATAASTTASTAAAGALTAQAAAARTLATAFGALGAAMGAIWGAGQIWEAARQGLGLMRDGFAQTATAAEQFKSHQMALAEASRVTGRQVTDLAEALRILADRNANLRALEAAQQTGNQGKAAASAAVDYKGFAQELARLQAVLDKLSPAQRQLIEDGKKLGKSNEEIAKAVGISEEAIRLYTSAAKAGTKATKDLAAEQERSARDLREFWNMVGERQMENAAMAMQAAEDTARAQRQFDNELGVRRMENEAAEMAHIEAQQAAWRQYYNWLGERRMEAEAAAMAAAKAGLSIAGSIKSAFEKLPQVIMSALTGGGDLGKSIGGLFGGALFGGDTGLVSKLTGGLKNLFGKSIGGALGSIIPGIGTLFGSLLGGLGDKLFGKLFKTEGRKVNDLRDAFIQSAGGLHELNVMAQKAGLTLDRLLRADKVKEFESAVRELNGAFEDQTRDLELAKQAAEEFGIPFERMGQAFKQAEIDAAATEILDKIRALSKSGVELSTIIEFAGDDLGRFIQRAIEAGTTVPREFKDIAQAMIEQGTLIDANGDKFTDLGQIPFAETINEQLSEMVLALKDIASTLKSSLTGALDAAGDVGVDAFNRISEAIRNVPRKIGIDIEVGNFVPPDFRQPLVEPAGFQSGVFRRNFGLGELAQLHGVESVVPRHQEMAFAQQVLSEQPRAGGETTNFVMVAIPLEAAGDSYRIADEVLRQWPDAARTNRAGIATAVERLWTDMHRTYGGRR